MIFAYLCITARSLNSINLSCFKNCVKRFRYEVQCHVLDWDTAAKECKNARSVKKSRREEKRWKRPLRDHQLDSQSVGLIAANVWIENL